MNSEIDPESMNHHWPKFSKKYLTKAFCRLSLVVLVVLCFMGLFAIMASESSSQNATDITVPTGLKDLLTNTLNDTEFSKRLPDVWKVTLGAAGTVGFGLLAAGFFIGPLTTGVSSWADYIAGTVLACTAATGATYGYSAWH